MWHVSLLGIPDMYTERSEIAVMNTLFARVNISLYVSTSLSKGKEQEH